MTPRAGPEEISSMPRAAAWGTNIVIREASEAVS